MDREAEDEAKQAYLAALRRLNAREYSSGELAAYLERKGFEERTVAAVVASLIEKKYLDDTRYARTAVRSLANRGKGSTFIRARLRQKGVDLSTTEVKTLVGEVADRPELETARELVARKYPHAAADRKEANRALQFLLRRGFSYEIARKALGKATVDDEG